MNDHAKERLDITTGFMRQIMDDIDIMSRASTAINEKIKILEHIMGGIYECNAKTSKLTIFNEILLFQILRYHNDVLALINETTKQYEDMQKQEEIYRSQNAAARVPH